MKIVDRKTFLKMPEGTVYAKIPTQWIVEDLCVKYESTDYNDWYYMSFNWVDANDSGEAVDRLDEMFADPTKSYPVENSIARDGLFDEDDHFLIYEADDIKHIVEQLNPPNKEEI
jgi:hypothetical protein